MARLSLFELLAPSLKSDRQLAAMAKAVDEELAKTNAAIDGIIIMPRIREQPENVLDNLAWQLHCDFYEPLTLTLEQKRDMVEHSLDWHTRKGTPSAVEEVVEAAFTKTETVEWYDYGGRNYFFKIIIDIADDDDDLTEERLQDIIRAVYVMKNTRSWIDFIEVLRMRNTVQQYIAIATHIKRVIANTPPPLNYLTWSEAEEQFTWAEIEELYTWQKAEHGGV